jgi:Na+-driven multidrug efflux pump
MTILLALATVAVRWVLLLVGVYVVLKMAEHFLCPP